MKLTVDELAYLGVEKLRMRFQTKIIPDQYYLSYSGGKDSHLLFWFIKEILKGDDIKIVAVNTYREHDEIRRRIYNNSDVVLYPTMKMQEIKEKYGMPCFTKQQDEFIKRYQRGCRTDYLLERVHGTNGTKIKLNNKARTLLLSGTLHKVSSDCCKYTKKQPLQKYEKQTGLKPIIGVRGSESLMRKSVYKSCVTTKGHFTPLHDFTDQMIDAIYDKYNIEKLAIYKHLKRTGCIGCPYGFKKGNLAKELKLSTIAQRKYAIDSFGESYKAIGFAE